MWGYDRASRLSCRGGPGALHCAHDQQRQHTDREPTQMPGDDAWWPTLETARLRLRRFREDDLEPFLAYRNDPEVARYQSWEHTSLAEAQAFIQAEQAARLGV